jgi:serine/threonine protein kinase
LAPELYFGSAYTDKSDIFSMGVILWELAYRCITGAHAPPYSEYEHITMPFQIIIKTAKESLRPTIHASTPEPIAALIRRSWAQAPDERPNTDELMTLLRDLQQVHAQNCASWDAVLAPPPPGVKRSSTPSVVTPTPSATTTAVDDIGALADEQQSIASVSEVESEHTPIPSVQPPLLTPVAAVAIVRTASPSASTTTTIAPSNAATARLSPRPTLPTD